jgi:hypothetical protein
MPPCRDVASDYAGSCGKCKEVKCKNTAFNDGYGQWLERRECHNEYASVVVMVTDTCPCHYPDNYSSNKRWCCGDMYHMDLSVWAFEKVSMAHAAMRRAPVAAPTQCFVLLTFCPLEKSKRISAPCVRRLCAGLAVSTDLFSCATNGDSGQLHHMPSAWPMEVLQVPAWLLNCCRLSA